MANISNRTYYILSIVGIVLFIGSAVMYFVFPELVSKKVQEKLPLRNDSESTKKWMRVSVPIYFRIYVWDIKNPESFQREGLPPQLVEKGPYTFREIRTKERVSFSEDGTNVTYHDIKTFYFEPQLSMGSLEDEVNVINVPLVGIIEKLYARKERTPLTGEIFVGMINRLIEASGEKLVMRKKVREILFEGYHVKLFQEINGMTSRFNIPFPSPLPNNTFGAFYGKNGTSPGVYTSYTGAGNVMDLKSIITFRQRTKVPHWTGDTCNQLLGTDGSAFHPKVKRKETLYLFNVDLCRSLYLQYERDASVRGIPVYKFAVPDKFYKAPANEPDNACYCTSEEGMRSPLCTTDGVLDISTCKKGAPIVLSSPHFYNGDLSLFQRVHGLKPEKRFHETFLEIEPITGLVLNAARRIQINVNVRSRKEFEIVRNINDVIMPFIWVEETATADDAAAGAFKSRVQNKLVIGNALIISSCVVGFLFFLVAVLVLYQRRQQEQKTSDTSSDIAKKNSYSSLPQKDTLPNS